MKTTIRLVPIAMLLALGSISSLAQEVRVGMKFGAGPVIGNPGTQAARASVNLALTGSYGISAQQEAFVELGYRSFKANDYEATRFGTGYTPTGATGGIILNHLNDGFRPGSVDTRKDQLQGLVLNLGYRQQISDTAFHVQGGLSLAYMRSKQEAIGMVDVVQLPLPAAGALVVLHREGFAASYLESSLAPGLFAGLQYRVNQDFFIETNLAAMNYKQINYVPLAYTGQPAHTETSSRSKVVLDVNFGFRF